jgi:Spy/CpxP family protein refolding chaperone
MSRTNKILALALALGAAAVGCSPLRSTSTPLDASRTAPSFTLSDQQGRRLPLGQALEGGPVVLIFHRGHR